MSRRSRAWARRTSAPAANAASPATFQRPCASTPARLCTPRWPMPYCASTVSFPQPGAKHHGARDSPGDQRPEHPCQVAATVGRRKGQGCGDQQHRQLHEDRGPGQRSGDRTSACSAGHEQHTEQQRHRDLLGNERGILMHCPRREDDRGDAERTRHLMASQTPYHDADQQRGEDLQRADSVAQRAKRIIDTEYPAAPSRNSPAGCAATTCRRQAPCRSRRAA